MILDMFLLNFILKTELLLINATPNILTKSINITAFEGKTIVLPCLVKNLRPENLVSN